MSVMSVSKQCCMNPKRSGIVTAFAFLVALGGAGFASVALGATPPAAQHTVPMRTFMMNFLKGANAYHYTPSANFVIPAVWLYSPRGKLMAVAGSKASLDSMTKGFPPIKSTAQPNQPDLQPLLTVVTSSAADKRPVQSDAGKWTAVLFTTSASGCHECAHFEQATRKFGNAHATELDAITVTLTP